MIEIEAVRTERPCQDCQGARLRHEARLVTLDGVTLPALSGLDLAEARAKLTKMSFSDEHRSLAAPLIEAILQRIHFLERAGLGYLTLGRHRTRFLAASSSGFALPGRSGRESTERVTCSMSRRPACIPGILKR